MGARQSPWAAMETPESAGERDAEAALRLATRRSDARAAEILAARECPADILQWGRQHGIEEFARITWQNGFQAGMRMAMMPKSGDSMT
jgi:hypothetical protein